MKVLFSRKEGNEWKEMVLNLFFPPKCPICGRVLDRIGICDVCRKGLPWVEEEHAIRKGPDGLRCAGALWYEEDVRDSLLHMKFRGGSSVIRPFGELIASCAAEQFSGEFDTVTWVPISRRRFRKRGFDQAELLARAACRRWDTEPVRLLKKMTDNPAQSGLQDAAARRANVLGVYEPVGNPEGKRILLVDDICTTGSTLTECVRVLRDAGAEDVVCVVVALSRGKTPPKESKNRDNTPFVQ